MFIAKIIFREEKKIQKLEVKSADIFGLLAIMSGFDDLDIIEIHIIKEII